jgi:hypothetical protein
MTYKYELELDSPQTASTLKKELIAVDSNLIVKLLKNNKAGGQTFTVKTSLENIPSFEERIRVDRQVKNIYDKYKNKISNFEESLQEMVRRVIREHKKRLNESTLIVKPSTPQDLIKLKKWFDNSDYYAEFNSEFRTFSLEEDNLDALEMELDKQLNKAGISVSYESE